MRLFAWIVLLTGVLVADRLLRTVSTSSSSPSSTSSLRDEVLSRSKRTPPTKGFEGKHIFHVDRFVRDFKQQFGYLPNGDELKDAILDKIDQAVAGLYRPTPPPMVTVLLLRDAEFQTFKDDKMDKLHTYKSGRPEYDSNHDYTFVDVSVDSGQTHRHLAIQSFEKGKIRIGKAGRFQNREYTLYDPDRVSHLTEGLADDAASARQVAYENELNTQMSDGVRIVKEARESFEQLQRKAGQHYRNFPKSNERVATCGHSPLNSCSCNYIRKSYIKKKQAELAKEAKLAVEAKQAKKAKLAQLAKEAKLAVEAKQAKLATLAELAQEAKLAVEAKQEKVETQRGSEPTEGPASREYDYPSE